MIERHIIPKLRQWRNEPNRKPLVIRGARQVGKTTLVEQFGNEFKQYIHLNLELPEDRQPFVNFSNPETLVNTIFFIKKKSTALRKDTLVFIDEIQEVPEAINLLRHLKEYFPDIPVIAAGSLLETLFDSRLSFPVGRVRYMVLRPMSFREFLIAMGEQEALAILDTIPLPDYAVPMLQKLFHQFALTGGMPEVVMHYATHRDLTGLEPLFDSMLNAYMEDVEKYASSQAQAQQIRHAISSLFPAAGHRIKFAGFGQSTYRSREMAEALRALEKAFLLKLIYPQTSTRLPLMPDHRKSPRLQFLDTGLMNFKLGIRHEIIQSPELESVYRGTMIEHLVGQEILAYETNVTSELCFWTREKKTSMAEVDYVLLSEGQLVPVEVKSGPTGKLRSLHAFMDEAPHDLAIRLHSGLFGFQTHKTIQNKPFRMIDLPYFLAGEIRRYATHYRDAAPSEAQP